jgi:SAM-dependent methyltransferase
MNRQLFTLIAVLIAMPYVLMQVRKPTRWVGRFFLWFMNRSHSGLTDWGLTHVPIEKDFTILDVGCGGGRTIQRLAAIATEGRVVGIDYSAGSVEASRATNAEKIREGLVEISQASVSQLPFPDAMFDLVTAVETHYYWPDLLADLKEVLRVVKPRGVVIVIAEAYRGGGWLDLVQRPAMALLRAKYLSADEHREWFTSAGLTDVQVFEEKSHGWIAITGRVLS